MNRTARTFAARLSAACAAVCAAFAGSAQAQDYDATIRQSMARMDAIVNQAQTQVHGIVQQRMHDPAVQAAWQRYLQQTGGRPQMNYYTFTYNYVYTNGFSAQGIAHARNNEAGIQAREQAAWGAYRQAQADRAQAQQAQRDGYFADQQEAGRQLTGRSTYLAPNGQALALPHTWAANTTHQYQGQTYHVDAGGRYHVLAANGWWYPLQGR